MSKQIWCLQNNFFYSHKNEFKHVDKMDSWVSKIDYNESKNFLTLIL